MKKRECAVVQDLLVLYEDGMLQEESMQMVEEHIRGCEECMHIYEMTEKSLPEIREDETSFEPQKEQEEPQKEQQKLEKQEQQAVQVMKKLKLSSLRWSQAVIVGIVAAIALVFIGLHALGQRITGDYNGLSALLYKIPSDEIEVEELYRLKNGEIYCTLSTEREIGVQTIAPWVVPDGEGGATDEAHAELSLRELEIWSVDGVEDIHQVTVVFPTERIGTVANGKEYVQTIREIQLRGKLEEDVRVIWEKGQKMEDAPEEIERNAIRLYIQEEQIAKAERECELLGWDAKKELLDIAEEAQASWYSYSDDGEGNPITYSNESEPVVSFRGETEIW